MNLQIKEPTEASAVRALVLCVDKDTREAVKYWLDQAGYVVDVPQSGTRAARMLRSSRYDAFVTDRFLPPWPGLDALPRFKRRFPDVRLVVLLCGAPIGLGALVRMAGADAVVEAPIRQADLLSALTLPVRPTAAAMPKEG